MEREKLDKTFNWIIQWKQCGFVGIDYLKMVILSVSLRVWNKPLLHIISL
jgi:hypothetical protein